MAKQIKCECRYIARAESEDEVVAKIRAHMRTDHPPAAGEGLRCRPPRLDRGDLR